MWLCPWTHGLYVSVLYVFVYNLKCLIIFVAYLCIWFHLSLYCFKLSVRCRTPLQPHKLTNAGICFNDDQAKSAAFLTLELVDEVFRLLKASVGDGGAELSGKYTFILGRSEAAGNWLLVVEEAPQTARAELLCPAGLEHNCAQRTVHQ